MNVKIDDGKEQIFGFSKADNALRTFEGVKLKALFPQYVPEKSMVDGKINFCGLALSGGYDENAKNLTFAVPSLGISEKFIGKTRKESVDKLVDFLKNGEEKGKDLLRHI